MKLNCSQLILAFFMVFGVIACNDDINVPNPESSSYFELYLTDCPYEADELNVEILKVYVQDKEGRKAELETNSGVYNLLDFQEGVDMLIASGDINIDNIKFIYFELGDENSIVINGDNFPLIVKNKFKVIKFRAEIFDFSDREFLVDFFACTSVFEKNGDFYLKPVIKFKGKRRGHNYHAGFGRKLDKIFKCYTVSYPINFLDASGNVVEVTSREELIDALRNQDVEGVEYPIVLKDKEENALEINSDEDWEEVIEACKNKS